MKLLMFILRFIASLFSVSVDVPNNVPANKRKVSFRKVTDREINKVKDYADVFGIDNSKHAKVDD